jgi:ketosteroid isomerase-like protein
VPKTGRLGPDKLVQLERDLAGAVQGRDLEKLDRILGEEFTLVTGRPGAETRDRQQYLDVAREQYVVDSFQFESIEPTVYGHVAVVRVRYRQQARLDGEDRSGGYLFTDVWVRRAGRWQLVTRHLSTLAS